MVSGEEIKKYDSFKDEKQKEYYQRTKDFLHSDKKILVNPGGMGLGKTWATINALIESPITFSFTAVPTAPAKNIWAEEFNNLGLNGEYAVWFSKSSCCIKKTEDPNFNITKYCKDDCKYWKNLQKNGIYTFEITEELFKLDKNLPTFPKEHYKKVGYKNCLMPVCRYGLKKRKYLIGDYLEFLNKNIFRFVINPREELNKLQEEGTLIIDEAHLVPERAKDFLSKTLNFTKTIEELEKETNCDYINRDLLLKYRWEKTISRLKIINDEIIRRSKKNEDRYNFDNFSEDYNSLQIEGSFEFDEFQKELDLLIKKGYKIDPENNYEEELYSIKLLNFIRMWEDKINDPTYKHYFQYKNINKKTVRFIINCCDTSKYLKGVFQKWDKILLNSGTIPDKRYFDYQTGISSFGENVEYKELLNSFSINDNVIIYGKGNFISTVRDQTYKEISSELNKIIDNLDGRTIIYIQSKYNSPLLKSLLNTDKEIIDFCSKDDGYSTKQEDWLELEKYFNRSNNSIAIMNINGRVEGFNFLDEKTNQPVDNILILGYPFPRRGPFYEDQLEYYHHLIKDKNIVRKWIDYTPVLIRIHQASCRAKRKESDNPVIILWDNHFASENLAYNYMPDDLKGEKCLEIQDIITNIKRIKERDVKKWF